jgi:hypothetical protein
MRFLGAQEEAMDDCHAKAFGFYLVKENKQGLSFPLKFFILDTLQAIHSHLVED